MRSYATCFLFPRLTISLFCFYCREADAPLRGLLSGEAYKYWLYCVEENWSYRIVVKDAASSSKLVSLSYSLNSEAYERIIPNYSVMATLFFLDFCNLFLLLVTTKRRESKASSRLELNWKLAEGLIFLLTNSLGIMRMRCNLRLNSLADCKVTMYTPAIC